MNNHPLSTSSLYVRFSNTKTFVTFIVIYAIFLQSLFLPMRTGAAVNSASQTVNNNPAVITRHRPTLNSGVLEGSLRLLTGESFNINGGITMSELFVPGTPSFTFNGGSQHGGIVSDGGAITPTGYSVTMNGGTISGRIHKQADPIAFPSDIPVAVPNHTGTRTVNINSPADVNNIGNWQTVANLTVNPGNLTIDVPPGNYRSITLNGSSTLRFTSGNYNFSNTVTLNNNSRIESTGVFTISIKKFR